MNTRNLGAALSLLALASTSCTPKPPQGAAEPIAPPDMSEKIQAGLDPSGHKYAPSAGDLSPEGFNWVHRDFALFVSGAIYQHGYKGVVRPEVMNERREQLMTYLETLRGISREAFAKWAEPHRVSFLINGYHAHLFLLSIDRKFKDLDDSLLELPGTVSLFGRSYSARGFVRDEIESWVKDPRVYLSLHCFAGDCPEYRNTVINFKNYEGFLESSAHRFFRDKDKNPSAHIRRYRSHFPASEAGLKKWSATYLKSAASR